MALPAGGYLKVSVKNVSVFGVILTFHIESVSQTRLQNAMVPKPRVGIVRETFTPRHLLSPTPCTKNLHCASSSDSPPLPVSQLPTQHDERRRIIHTWMGRGVRVRLAQRHWLQLLSRQHPQSVSILNDRKEPSPADTTLLAQSIASLAMFSSTSTWLL